MRLEPGVAVVIGPNGSGKSNVSDAILWATGSLSPHELRAEKPDDVLFAGSAQRKPVDFCEVELVFDNEDGAWPELPFAEVSVARRLHRGGEGQYLVNRAAVRRLDLVELLSDVGLGGGLRSVISQGSVESVLGAKPAERRALVEEAAGLGRFKLRRHRAELKLARVATQVERARDLEDEVRKRLRPLALQATAAERAEKLGEEIAGARRPRSRRSTSARLGGAARRGRGAGARRRSPQRRELEAKLEALLAERTRAEEELTDAAGAREGATAALYRLRTGGRAARASARGAPRRSTRSSRRWAGRRRRVPGARRRDDLADRAQLARERLAALEQALAEREGLPPAARALAEEGERLALSLLDVEPGAERAVAAALGQRASASSSTTPARALELVERARAAGLGSLVVLVGRDPQEPRAPGRPARGAARLARAGGHRGRDRLGSRSAASSGSPARRRRRSCSSSRRAAAGSRPRSPSSSGARRADGPARSACRRRRRGSLAAADAARRRARRRRDPVRGAAPRRGRRLARAPSSAPSCAGSAPTRSSSGARPPSAARARLARSTSSSPASTPSATRRARRLEAARAPSPPRATTATSSPSGSSGSSGAASSSAR